MLVSNRDMITYIIIEVMHLIRVLIDNQSFLWPWLKKNLAILISTEERAFQMPYAKPYAKEELGYDCTLLSIRVIQWQSSSIRNIAAKAKQCAIGVEMP